MRTIPTVIQQALSGQLVPERWIVRCNLPGLGWFGASNAPDTFAWDNGFTGSVTYHGMDTGLVVSLPALTGAPRADPATVTLAATDPTLLASLLNEPYRAAPFEIALLFNSAGVPAAEWMKFQGLGGEATFIDAPVRPLGGREDDKDVPGAVVQLTVWPDTVDLKRSRGRMATNVDQQLFRDAADTFFQDVALVGVSQMNWGQKGSSSPAASATTRASPGGAPSGLGALAGNLAGAVGGIVGGGAQL